MSEASYFWPRHGEIGDYLLETKNGFTALVRWDGERFFSHGVPYTIDHVMRLGWLGVRREPAKAEPISRCRFTWPSECGEYMLFLHNTGETKAKLTADGWLVGAATFPQDVAELERLGFIGVRVERMQPTPKTITPDPDDGNAMVAQEALDEWRACKQQPKAADWAYRWAVDLCERLGAR